MAHLYVATNGLSVWRSTDLGKTLDRMSTGTGLYSGSPVWSLALHPSSPRVLLAGTNTGVYRLDQAASNWTHITSPMDEAALVTALAYAPDNPDIILAGTQPAGLYRSEDGGESWRKLEVPMKPYALTGYYLGYTPFPKDHPDAGDADRVRSVGCDNCLGGRGDRRCVAQHGRRRALGKMLRGYDVSGHSRLCGGP